MACEHACKHVGVNGQPSCEHACEHVEANGQPSRISSLFPLWDHEFNGSSGLRGQFISCWTTPLAHEEVLNKWELVPTPTPHPQPIGSCGSVLFWNIFSAGMQAGWKRLRLHLTPLVTKEIKAQHTKPGSSESKLRYSEKGLWISTDVCLPYFLSLFYLKVIKLPRWGWASSLLISHSVIQGLGPSAAVLEANRGGRRLAEAKVSPKSTGKAEVSKAGVGKPWAWSVPWQHLRVGITKCDTDASPPRACYWNKAAVPQNSHVSALQSVFWVTQTVSKKGPFRNIYVYVCLLTWIYVHLAHGGNVWCPWNCSYNQLWAPEVGPGNQTQDPLREQWLLLASEPSS